MQSQEKSKSNSTLSFTSPKQQFPSKTGETTYSNQVKQFIYFIFLLMNQLIFKD